MRNAIGQLLKKENISADEIDDFSDMVKKIGKEHIRASEISKDLNTDYIGKNLYIYREVTSTNTIAKFLSQNGAENGSVVISEKQTSGKGRSGKSWQSPLGGVWLSIILAPDFDYSKLPLITLTTGVAVAKTLEKIGIENPEIKWPNDILINGKKVCGILTEAASNFNRIEHVIVGVGIDANLSTNDMPKELQNITTSLKDELNTTVDENQLITLFLMEFEKVIELFNSGEYEKILKEWRKRSYTIGKVVEVRKHYNKPYDAYVVGIGKDGGLVVERNDGSLEKVISGECIIKN